MHSSHKKSTTTRRKQPATQQHKRKIATQPQNAAPVNKLTTKQHAAKSWLVLPPSALTGSIATTPLHTIATRDITTQPLQKLKKKRKRAHAELPAFLQTPVGNSFLHPAMAQLFSTTTTTHNRQQHFTAFQNPPQNVFTTAKRGFFNAHDLKSAVKGLEEGFQKASSKARRDYFNPFTADRGKADQSHTTNSAGSGKTKRRETVNKKKKYDESDDDTSDYEQPQRKTANGRIELEGEVPFAYRMKKYALMGGLCLLAVGAVVTLVKFAWLALQLGLVYLAARFVYRMAISHCVKRGDISTALLIETFGESHKNDGPIYKALWTVNPVNLFRKAQAFVSKQRRRYERKLELQQKLTQCLQHDPRMVEMFGDDFLIGNMSVLYGDYGLENEVMLYDGYIAVPIYSGADSTIDITAKTSNSNNNNATQDKKRPGTFETDKERVQYIHDEAIKLLIKRFGPDGNPTTSQYGKACQEVEEKIKQGIDAFDDADYDYKYYSNPSTVFKQSLEPEDFENYCKEKKAVFYDYQTQGARIDQLDYNHVSFKWSEHVWKTRIPGTPQSTAKSTEGPLRPKKDHDLREIGVVYCFYSSRASAIDLDQGDEDDAQAKAKIKINLYDMVFGTSKPYEMVKVLALSEHDTYHQQDNNDAFSGERKRNNQRPHRTLFSKTPSFEDMLMHGIQIDTSNFEEVKWKAKPQIYKDRTVDRFLYGHTDKDAEKVVEKHIKESFGVFPGAAEITTNKEEEYNDFNSHTTTNKRFVKNDLDYDLNERYMDAASPTPEATTRRHAQAQDVYGGAIDADVVQEAQVVEAQVVEAEIVQDNVSANTSSSSSSSTKFSSSVSNTTTNDDPWNTPQPKKPFTFDKF